MTTIKDKCPNMGKGPNVVSFYEHFHKTGGSTKKV
jgi:hypothetical protein